MKVSYRGDCIRSMANFSKQTPTDKFDKIKFDQSSFAKKIPIISPKLEKLLKTINKLDDDDMKLYGKRFKHIIYTDIKKSSAGAKMIAAGMLTNGFKNVYDKSLKIYDDIEKYPFNFALLSSTAVYDKPFPVTLKKKILSIFNQRPDNIYGEKIRFLVIDQGYKEGIDVFDVKYLHLFEPLITDADEKQAIGRGTRFCGQKGLEFDNKAGWPLHVYKYDLLLDDDMNKEYKSASINELFLRNSGIDLNKLIFSSELESISKYGAVDKELTENIHNYKSDQSQNSSSKSREELIYNITGSKKSNDSNKSSKNCNEYTKYRCIAKARNVIGGGIKGKKKKGLNLFLTRAPTKSKGFLLTRAYVRERFSQYKWKKIVFENKCINSTIKDTPRIISFTPTQEFLPRYFNNTSANKGLLLWHSVGTGKTCSAISIATSGFEPHGYTILWVTRHTLKSDIWKNMFGNICSASLRRKFEKGEDIPEEIPKNPLKHLSNNWVLPISYKQFTNMLLEKNEVYKTMVKRNGAEDPLKKTLVVIDEVHKLYSGDMPAAERPNVKILKEKIKKSYKVSGKDSVRLLLLSATPYTSNPMDLIKIINLMKDSEDMPEVFEDFKKEYLDEDSKFTDAGAEKYLDNIAPYISYLNRERDIRQFAYPVFHYVNAYMSRSDKNETDKLANELEKIDLKLMKLEGIPLKGKEKKEKEQIKSDIRQLKSDKKAVKKNMVIAKKEMKEDDSQETALLACMKK